MVRRSVKLLKPLHRLLLLIQTFISHLDYLISSYYIVLLFGYVLLFKLHPLLKCFVLIGHLVNVLLLFLAFLFINLVKQPIFICLILSFWMISFVWIFLKLFLFFNSIDQVPQLLVSALVERLFLPKLVFLHLRMWLFHQRLPFLLFSQQVGIWLVQRLLGHLKHLFRVVCIVGILAIFRIIVRLWPLITCHQMDYIEFKLIDEFLPLLLSFPWCEVFESLFQRWVGPFQSLH